MLISEMSFENRYMSKASVADLERHLPCKQIYVSANLTVSSFHLHSLHDVISSIPPCEGDGVGAEPTVGTISFVNS